MVSELQKLCQDKQVKIQNKVDSNPGDVSQWGRGSSHWRVTLKFEGRRATFEFHQGPAITQEPTAADVLSCLCSDAAFGEESFEDFCGELGCNLDSRKDFAAYKACQVSGRKVRKLLGESFDRFARAQH